MDADALIHDYLARLDATAAALPVGRRAELTMQVREHIDTALGEAGKSDEVTVRNVLDRLGSPEEIVVAEVAAAGTAAPAANAARVAPMAGGPAAMAARPRLGPIEVIALLLLTLAWPALFFLPFGGWFWIGGGAVGLIFVWLSEVWSTRQKVVTTAIVVALYVLFVALTTPVTLTCTTGNPPVACPPGGPQPSELSIPAAS
ncbi:MAG TPA: hypothetical protein VKR30_05425 [Candidatus Limnocylindrales bacterium]|nr:hypothetical protein [Candidatus Limnocylindrales bacterium]